MNHITGYFRIHTPCLLRLLWKQKADCSAQSCLPFDLIQFVLAAMCSVSSAVLSAFLVPASHTGLPFVSHPAKLIPNPGPLYRFLLHLEGSSSTSLSLFHHSRFRQNVTTLEFS